jgi:hypothetical protein
MVIGTNPNFNPILVQITIKATAIIISGIIKGKSIAPYDKPLYLTLYLVKAFAANKAMKVLIIEAITPTLILFHNA